MEQQIPPERIHGHNNDLVELRWRQLSILRDVMLRESRQEGLIGKESGRKYQDCSWYEKVSKDQAGALP